MSEREQGAALSRMLLELDEAGVLNLVGELLGQGTDPLFILEQCQQGMTAVGLRYENKEYYLSGLMMAGEIFRQVMELTKPLLRDRLQGCERGHLLLGTVQGDIHDIGKNTFGTMMRCHGFTITDLGVDVPPAQFRDAVEKEPPDMIGLSALLTVAFDTMRQTTRLIRRSADPRVAQTPIIIGGLVNSDVCTYVGADYWSTDAMVGVKLCMEIMQKR